MDDVYYLRHGESYVFTIVRRFVYLSVCLFVCLSVSNIARKRINGFSQNFQDRWDLVQGIFWNILGMFHVTFCILFFFFFFFLGGGGGGGGGGNPWFLATLWKDSWKDFHKIARAGWIWDKEQ